MLDPDKPSRPLPSIPKKPQYIEQLDEQYIEQRKLEKLLSPSTEFLKKLPSEIKAVVSGLGEAEIQKRFSHHPPTQDINGVGSLEAHQSLYTEFKRFARYLDSVLPPGRAKSVAFTELENVSMWAHKAIAETDPVVPS